MDLMTNKFIPLASRRKEELEELCEGFEIVIPEDCSTKKALVILLEENGVTNKSLKMLETEDQRPKTAEDERESFVRAKDDECVVAMDRTNPSFGFGKYEFTQERRYVVMKKEEARELIGSLPGFRVATIDEVLGKFRV